MKFRGCTNPCMLFIHGLIGGLHIVSGDRQGKCLGKDAPGGMFLTDFRNKLKGVVPPATPRILQ